KEVHHEPELAVIIGNRLRRASESECAKAVAGVTCLNDVTARDIQRSEGQWTRAKGFDTFCPVGPWVTVGLDWSNLRVQCRVNGVVKQDGRTKDQVFPVPRLLAFITAGMTLEPGDVVTTGTPAGVGPIRAGDVVEVEVEGVGVLRNEVRAEGTLCSPGWPGTCKRRRMRSARPPCARAGPCSISESATRASRLPNSSARRCATAFPRSRSIRRSRGRPRCARPSRATCSAASRS